uniref:Uncharacterized protein n=1 Tax=Strix occidentalis caurina TaxID=311401 RepID=A0A8D0KYD9_STROC
MGMCSRQERIQKDIDVVIQKCKAEKDCLFAGEFLFRASGWRRGCCAVGRRSRERGPPSSRRVPALSSLLPPPPLFPRACEGR